MNVSPGSKLGSYELLAPLGAGGMGEVFTALDPKLGRKVAIKILPERLAGDPSALARFEREAKALAALSHPGILSIFELGRDGAVAYVVTELLEGRTLREAFRDGPMAPRRVAELGAGLAQGLAAAHAKGIVHRDIKPENLFITRDGVKILDFGLARTEPPALAQGQETRGVESNLTGEGMLLGTVGYMSPEQVRGGAADGRSDLFSLGVVLYEALAGRAPFRGSSGVETLNAILKEEPPEWEQGSRTGIPPALDRVVRHCLEKDPERRFQSANDLAFALQAATGASSSAERRRPELAGPRRRWALPLAACAAVAAGLWAYWAGGAAERRALGRIHYLQQTWVPQPIFQAAFAPDGETIVFSAALQGNDPELFMIRPEYPEPKAMGLPHTHLLAISSKGELAVLTGAQFINHRLFRGTLARVMLGGTAPRELLQDVRQADWSPDGSQLAIIHTEGGKDRLEYPVGKVLYQTNGYLSDLRVAPKGDRIAFFEHPVEMDDRGSLVVVDLAGRARTLASGFTAEEGIAWAPAGDEVLFSASITGTAFELYRVDLAGHRRQALTSAGGLTIHDVSRTGRWLVTRDDKGWGISGLAPGATAERDLTWLEESGGVHISADGQKVLFTQYSYTGSVNYLVGLRSTDGGPVVALGEGDAQGLSPDGRSALALCYTPPELVVYPTGPGATRHLPLGSLEAIQVAFWLPDGQGVLLVANEPGKLNRGFRQKLAGGLPEPVTPEGVQPFLVSPDGHDLVCRMPDGTLAILREGQAAARPMAFLAADDSVTAFTPDGTALLLQRRGQIPAQVERLDLASGRRTPVQAVAPTDRVGILNIGALSRTPSGNAYAYSYLKMKSALFVVEGAR